MFKRYIFISCLIIGMVFCVNYIVKADNGACPFDREMSLGNENSSVKELQKFLALDKNVYSGPITGYFGPVTQKAVKVFQTKAGLLANGKVDLATATILCQAYLSYKSSMPISNEENLTIGNGCFLKTLNLEIGTFKNPNEEVLQLQKWLAINGFYPEKMFTGFFGPLTKKAVQRFQKAVGIVQTGIVGIKTTAVICGGGGALGDNIKINSVISQGGTSDFPDLGISFIDINPKQIGVGSKINILVKEKNLSFKTADSHVTSFFINDKEKTNKTIPILKSGEEYTSINYDWTCEQKGIYIFKIFIDSANNIIEGNKYNNILVFPVNCGGAVQDFKYACNEETQNCEVDISGSMTFGECNAICKSNSGSLPDLYVKDFSPMKIKIKETLPLKIVEGNSGGVKAPRHEYLLTVAFNGETKSQTQVFGEILAKGTQEAGGSWTCTAAGVYTITIDLDPKNSVKEMNEQNNKKTFKMECSDIDGNVPADKSDTSGDDDNDPSGDQDSKSNLPDLKVTMSPATMVNGGVNRIIVTVTNQGKINIDKQFYIGLEVADANGQRTKIKKDGKDVQVSFMGLAAGATQSINLFDSTDPSSGQKCDTQNPFEIWAIADVTTVITEANENNNTAKSSCGAVKSSTGGSGGSGGGTGSGDEEETGTPCYKDSKNGASLKYGDVSTSVLGQSYLDGHTEEIATIKYKLIGENAETASEIVSGLYDENNNELESEGMGSILGCKVRSGYFRYNCAAKENSLKLKLTYKIRKDGEWITQAIEQAIKVTCQYGSTKADGTPYAPPLQYCKINKAISPDDGTVRVSDGEQIRFYISNVAAPSIIWKWAGGKQFDNIDDTSAYISFSTVGRYTVSGITATVGERIENCPTFTVIVANAGSSSSGGTKYPNLSRDTKCISNLDLRYLNGEICFTNYITDLNNSTTMCPSLEYSWLTKNGTPIINKINKTACFPKSQFVNSSTQPGTIETIQTKATCKGNDSYTQTIKCYINAYKEGSSGISASCSGTKISAGKVRFSVTASSSDCSISNLKYNWDNSTTYTTSQTFDKTYTPSGSQTITSQVKVLCSTNNASTTVNCSLSVTDGSSGGGSLPPESKPIESDNLSTACSCSGQTCTASMKGKSTSSSDYWCTWTINGATKLGTRCAYPSSSVVQTAKVLLEYNGAYSGWTNEKATATCTVN